MVWRSLDMSGTRQDIYVVLVTAIILALMVLSYGYDLIVPYSVIMMTLLLIGLVLFLFLRRAGEQDAEIDDELSDDSF
ncbi:hypothetical protein ASD80_10115 [Devosia sp. Root635]|nr:hypothetical protein ASD80_10115 [Devosia sp. Root635]